MALHVHAVVSCAVSAGCVSLSAPSPFRYYELIRLPLAFGSPTWYFGSAYLSLDRNLSGLSSSQRFSCPVFFTGHATLFVDPGRPSESSPFGCFHPSLNCLRTSSPSTVYQHRVHWPKCWGDPAILASKPSHWQGRVTMLVNTLG